MKYKDISDAMDELITYEELSRMSIYDRDKDNGSFDRFRDQFDHTQTATERRLSEMTSEAQSLRQERNIAEREIGRLRALLIESSVINVDNGFQALMGSDLREWFVEFRKGIIIQKLSNKISGLGEMLRERSEGGNIHLTVEDMAEDIKNIDPDFTLYYVIVASLSEDGYKIEETAGTFYSQFEDRLNKEFLKDADANTEENDIF